MAQVLQHAQDSSGAWQPQCRRPNPRQLQTSAALRFYCRQLVTDCLECVLPLRLDWHPFWTVTLPIGHEQLCLMITLETGHLTQPQQTSVSVRRWEKLPP